MSTLPINHPLLRWARRLADSLFSPLGAIAATALAVLVFGCAYTVDQTEQVVLTQFGRKELEREILAAAIPKMGIWGIELLDVRVKRVNYKDGVIEKIYDRMISERMQIAERFRSEGAGEAAKIEGRREKDLQRIQSDAYRKVQEIKGEADAKASAVYARIYASSPAAADFYAFVQTLDTYKTTLGADSTVIFTTDSDYFRLLKRIEPAAK